MFDIVAHYLFIETDGCDVKATCPKAFAYKVPALAHKIASNINGTFPFDIKGRRNRPFNQRILKALLLGAERAMKKGLGFYSKSFGF